MADDTSAALIASLDVKFDQLASNMKKAMTVFDNGGRQLEKRQKQIKKNLSDWAIDFTGLGGINKALVGLTGAGIIGGLGALVKTSLDAASAIGDTAQQAGVSVEFLQKMRFAASQSGASFELMDTALTTLNKTLGDFVNTGAGKGATAFKALGIDKLINGGQVRDAQQAFDAISRNLQKFSSESQKSSLLAGVFGKEAGPKLLQLMNQGADGIAKLEAQAVSLGIVLSANTVAGAKEASDKLDALFNVIKAQGVAAVASLAPEIAELAQEITDGLPDLILWVERWADWFGILKLSPVQKLKADIKDVQDQISSADSLKASWLTNPFGLMSMNIDQKKAELVSKLKGLQADLAKATGGDVPTPSARPNNPPKLHVAPTAAEIAAAQRAKELAQHRADLVAQTGADAKTAAAALLVAQDQTQVQLLKGSADYYGAVQKQIEDEYSKSVAAAEAEAAKQKEVLGKKGKDWDGYATGIANIESTLNDKIAAAGEERKQKLDETGPSSTLRQALTNGDIAIKQYQDQTATLGMLAGATVKYNYIQEQVNAATEKGIELGPAEMAQIQAKAAALGQAAQSAADANETFNDQLQVTDSVRNGLSQIGVAARHGFSSAKDAAVNFLDTLVDTISQLYVMKPLLNSLLGPSGTTGGGVIGALLSSIPGFASGTNSAPGGLAVVGERGPELVNLPRGAQVIPNVPRTAMRGPAPVIQQFDLRGAVMTEDLLAQMNAIGKQAANEGARNGAAIALRAQPQRAMSFQMLGK
jgi:hypothetical protein